MVYTYLVTGRLQFITIRVNSKSNMINIILATVIDAIPVLATIIIGWALFKVIAWFLAPPIPKVKYIVNTKYYKVMDIVN